jgi:hypothetical protein
VLDIEHEEDCFYCNWELYLLMLSSGVREVMSFFHLLDNNGDLIGIRKLSMELLI